MIEIEMYKDLKDQSAKVAGPFTLRQLICGIGAVATSLGSYFLTRNFMPESLNGILPIFLAAPFALVGFVRLYELPFEKFAKIIIETYLIPPKNRIYKVENSYEKLEQELIAEDIAKQNAEWNAQKKPKKKNKEA